MDLDFTKPDFGADFNWGVSVAAYQIEGAHKTDGKGLSIWDSFTSKKGKIYNNQNGNIACDFYHSYREDIDRIKSLNFPNFRFSIAWSRILPLGTGEINPKGIDFYNNVINYCLKVGVEPWLTLYHWDLPQALEEKGGWTNREIVGWFTEFTKVCALNFGDRVKYWMVMNEPTVFTGAGYFLGIHAPGRKGLKNFIPAIHHTVLSMVSSARILRDLLPETAQIGSTFSCSYIEPATTSRRDVEAALRLDTLVNRVFIEPILGLGYPAADLSVLKKLNKYIFKEDIENMSFDFDFIGVQNYTREIVSHSFFVPYLKAKLIKAENRKVAITSMKWEIYPESIYQMIKKFNAYPQIKKIIITENGAAFPDHLEKGEINDTLRTEYLKSYLSQVLRAKNEGCKVDGYFVWTLLDNFEWAEGYHPTFGLIHVDFQSQKRTIKNSGKWFKSFLAG